MRLHFVVSFFCLIFATEKKLKHEYYERIDCWFMWQHRIVGNMLFAVKT